VGVRPSTGQKQGSALVALAATAVLLAVVALLIAGGDGGRPEQFAEQFDAPPVTIGSGSSHAWSSLDEREGIRSNWPVPMLARGVELCFGFGRVDFVPTRPSLARCVDRAALPELPANGVVPVMSVQAGLDVWYVLTTGSAVDSLDLRSSSDAVGPERVHVDEDVIVLRLPAGARIEELSWVSGRTRFVCRPPAGVVSADRFCGPTEPSPTATRPSG
jgi:hypothetical protein